MANFFDQFDSGASAGASSSNFFDQFDEGSQQPANNEGNFTRGLKNSFRQLPQLGYGIEAIAGATGEKLAGEGGLFTGLKQHGIKNYQREAEELAPFSKENDSISTAWEKAKGGDIGALGDFGGYGLGYVTGQGAQALATAGVGKLLAQQGVKAVAPSIIEAVTAKEAAKLAGKGLAESEVQQIAAKNALAKIGTYGANTALAANALGMEGGEIGGGMVANAEQRGTPLTGEELVKGGLSTLGAGALEYLGDKIGIDAAFGKMPIGKALSEAPGVSGRVGRGLVGGAMAAVPEAGTEYGQTMLEQYGQGQDPFSAESQRQAIDAAALGALGGQVMGGAGGLVSSAQPKVVEKPISDGPLGNAAAAGGITQTEISDAGTTNQEALIPEQNLGGSSGAVLPASNGLGEPNDAMPEPESLVDQTGAATTGNEAEPALATQQAPSPVDFQPTHLADDGTPVAYREDDQGPYFETVDGQQWDYTDTATPITQEVQNANSPTGSVDENNPPITGQDSGIGSDQRGFDTSIEPTDGRADDRGISGVDGQLRGAESPSDVESGGALDETSTTPNINVSQAQTSESELPSMEDTASATSTANTAALVGDATTVSNQSSGVDNISDIFSENWFDGAQAEVEKRQTERDTVKNAISEYAADQARISRDLEAKTYKDNKQVIDFGDAYHPYSDKTSMSIGDINESKKRRRIEQANKNFKKATEIFSRLNNGSLTVEDIAKEIERIEKFTDSEDARIPKGMSKQDYVESIFSQSFLDDDYGGFGNGSISNKIISIVKKQRRDTSDAKQASETQPVLPDTGANQTGNAAPMGVGQGQSAVSGQGWSEKITRMKSEKSSKPEGDLPSEIAVKNNVHSGVKIGEFKALGNYLGNKEGANNAGFYDGILPVKAEKFFKRFVDVFAGSGIVTGLVKRSSNIPVVLNDGDADTVNFHRQVQANPEAVKTKAAAYREQAAQFQSNKESFQKSKADYKKWWSDQEAASQQAGDIDRAAWTFFKNTSFGRARSIPAVARGEVNPSAVESRIDGHVKTLSGANIQNEDAAQLLDKIGNGDLANLDPPYTPEEGMDTVSGYEYQGAYNLEKMDDGPEFYATRNKDGKRVFLGEKFALSKASEKNYSKIDRDNPVNRKGKLSWINEKVIPAAQRGAGIIYTDNADTRIIEALKQAGFYVKLQRPSNSKRIELIAWNSPVATAVSGGIRQPSGRRETSGRERNTSAMAGNLPASGESGRLANGSTASTETVSNTGAGATGLRRRGDGGVKLSVANKPTLTALFDQLGKLKAAEKANKDVKALIDAHPKAELIRHVQNHWTDILMQHEKNSDNPNGKVTIQC